MDVIIAFLTDKDDKAAYEFTKQIAAASEFSDEYYQHLDEFASLLDNKSSYIRTRAFILCCSQARWDKDRQLETILPEMMNLFHDPKPTVVRQCLNAIKEVMVFCPELSNMIMNEVSGIDVSGYKDSMSPLILKDINELVDLAHEL